MQASGPSFDWTHGIEEDRSLEILLGLLDALIASGVMVVDWDRWRNSASATLRQAREALHECSSGQVHFHERRARSSTPTLASDLRVDL